ncbi:MAG: BamA/TamA family outer membrane protein [Paracoccaceae bacterium]
MGFELIILIFKRVPVVALICCFGFKAIALDTATLTAPGAPKNLLEALRASSLSIAAKRDGVNSAQDILAAARADYTRLVGVLYANARYGGVVHIYVDGREAASIAPLAAPRQIRDIRISVDPGPVFRFGTALIAPMAPQVILPDGFATGQPANSGVIGDAVSAAITGWRDAGFAKAQVAAQDLRADHRTQRLDTSVRLSPGTQLRFGQLILEGESAVHVRRIQQIADLRQGGVFSPADVDAVATRLRRTGAFRSVAISEAEKQNADGTLDITAQLVDEKPNRFGFGAEISTGKGATLSGFWLHRNLFGGAERLRVDGEVSGIGGISGGADLKFGARYERPATFGPDTSLFVVAKAEQLDELDFLSTHFGLGGGVTRIFSKELSGELALEWRQARVEDKFGVQKYDLVSLPLSLTWDQRDKALNASSGHYLQTEFRPFLGFGNMSSGARFYADGRIYRSMSDRLVLAGRLQMGSVYGPGVAVAPPDYLFYSGGGGSVRGQGYQSLGIDLASGQRRGGRSFLGVSAEARFEVTDTIGIVGFADTGYIGSGSIFDNSGNWHSGVGLGLRYNTGIGPIRLDVAVPVGGTGIGAQIYIGIGQSF